MPPRGARRAEGTASGGVGAPDGVVVAATCTASRHALLGSWPATPLGRVFRGLVPGLLLLCAACAGFDESQRAPLETVAARMPGEIAGFVRGEIPPRPVDVLTLDYATPNRGAVATVQVNATGGRSVPSDPASPDLDRALTAAVSEVTEAPQGRTGRRLAERERLTIADPGLRCAIMEGAFGRAPVTRHVCVGSAQGRLVKVQVTMATRRPPPADAVAFAAGALRAVRGP